MLIGDSSADRFPASSYAAHGERGKRFHCPDLGGPTESRGPVKGGEVYAALADIPAYYLEAAPAAREARQLPVTRGRAHGRPPRAALVKGQRIMLRACTGTRPGGG